MGTKYEIFDRTNNYKGGYGHADKKKVHSIDASRFEISFFPIEDLYAKLSDHSSSMITTMGLASRERRNLAIDAQNPQEKLPEDPASALMQDAVPPFAWTTPHHNLDIPEDFELNDQVKLIQQAFLNAKRQASLYDDPQVMQDETYNTDKVGKGNQPSRQIEVYGMEGSAAGLTTNRLDDEPERVESIETMTAF